MNRSILLNTILKTLNKINKNNYINAKNENKITLFNSNICCNYSFEKPNNLKEIFNSWDVFIN
jgi:hypothetical protein